MLKHSIVINKEVRTKGYSSLTDFSRGFILDKVVEYTKDKDIRVLDALIRKEWVENKDYPREPHPIPALKHVDFPKGDEITYLDIYYELR